MSADLSSQEIIASALQLPLADRELILEALQESLFDESIDHGSRESAGVVESACSEEIARRVADIDSGRVKTVPSEEAERMIRGDAGPSI